MKTNAKWLAFAALIFVCPVASSQDLGDVMADEVCECMNRKDLSAIENSKLTIEVGLCIVEAYGKHPEANAYFGIENFDEEGGRIMGQKLAVKLVNICPQLITRLAELKNNIGEGSGTYELTGKIEKMEEGDFVSYHVRDKGGKVYKVLWYQNFTGSSEFIQEPKKLVGKKVTVTVKDVECYIPKAKGYYSIKEIQQIKLL
jgi:hypothetical protein